MDMGEASDRWESRQRENSHRNPSFRTSLVLSQRAVVGNAASAAMDRSSDLPPRVGGEFCGRARPCKPTDYNQFVRLPRFHLTQSSSSFHDTSIADQQWTELSDDRCRHALIVKRVTLQLARLGYRRSVTVSRTAFRHGSLAERGVGGFKFAAQGLPDRITHHSRKGFPFLVLRELA